MYGCFESLTIAHQNYAVQERIQGGELWGLQHPESLEKKKKRKENREGEKKEKREEEKGERRN